jgi:hypothetical protein
MFQEMLENNILYRIFPKTKSYMNHQSQKPKDKKNICLFLIILYAKFLG